MRRKVGVFFGESQIDFFTKPCHGREGGEGLRPAPLDFGVARKRLETGFRRIEAPRLPVEERGEIGVLRAGVCRTAAARPISLLRFVGALKPYEEVALESL